MSRWFPERPVLWLWPQRADPELAAFERELDRRALSDGARLTCVVAGEAVRYRIVPWNDDLSSPLQRQVLSVNCFTEAYGDMVRDWTVRQHTARHGVASVACALDTAWLDRLTAMTQARQLGLVSVQPALMHAYNQVCRGLDTGMFWFIFADGPCITLLLMSPAEPLLVKAMPSQGVELSKLLDREWFMLGLEVPRCTVYVLRLASIESPVVAAGDAWNFVELPPLHDGMLADPAARSTRQTRQAA